MINVDTMMQEIGREEMSPEQRTAIGMKVMMSGFALAFKGIADQLPGEAVPAAAAPAAPVSAAPAKAEKKGRAGTKKAASAPAAPAQAAVTPAPEASGPMLPSQAKFQTMNPEDVDKNFLVDAMKEKREELVGRLVEPAPVLKELLTSFGVMNLSQLPPEKNVEFLNKLWKL